VLCTSALQPCFAAFAAVLQAIDRQSNTHVALKVYQTSRLHELNRYQVLREVYLHAHLQHVNIIQMYAAFQVGLLVGHADGCCWKCVLVFLGLGISLMQTYCGSLGVSSACMSGHLHHGQTVVPAQLCFS
jgi:serine/threonine protein kinase